MPRRARVSKNISVITVTELGNPIDTSAREEHRENILAVFSSFFALSNKFEGIDTIFVALNIPLATTALLDS